MADMTATWTDSATVDLDGMRVTLSEPILIGRRRGYFWFPNLWTMPNGELLSTISPVPDIHLSGVPYLVLWSQDGGLTWTEPQVSCDGGQTLLHTHAGDSILLPYDLRPRPNGIGAPHNFIPAGKRVFDYVPTGVVITGMPAPVPLILPGLDVVTFSFNGQTLWLQDGTYLATAYGHFEGDERDSIVAVESTDGTNWSVRSVVADANCPVPGDGGPSESAICRLQDGRIMCGLPRRKQTALRPDLEQRRRPLMVHRRHHGRPLLRPAQPRRDVRRRRRPLRRPSRPLPLAQRRRHRSELAADRHPRPPQQLPPWGADRLLGGPLPPAKYLLYRSGGRR